MPKEQLKPVIILSVPLVWGVRNYVRSGIAETLSKEFRIIYSVPKIGKEGLLKEGVNPSNIFVYPEITEKAIYRKMMMILRNAHEMRHPTETSRIFSSWNNGNSNKSTSLSLTLKNALFRQMIVAARYDRMFNLLEKKERKIFSEMIPSSVFDFLKQTKPVLGLSTCFVSKWEWPLFQAMKEMGILTVTHISSFDNITSRGYLPIKYFDHYLVWQENMSNELRHFYDIPDSKITTTGTPQFDFHIKKKFYWSKEKTARVLGIDPNQPYFVYCANHSAITPNEPDLVTQIITESSKDEVLKNYQWVLRLHPMDNYKRWEKTSLDSNKVAISYPWEHEDKSASWGMPSSENLALLGNTLRYAAVTLSVASTISLDSAVIDIPIICVGYHPGISHENSFYYHVHFSDHYRPIMDTKATPLATNITSVKNLLKDAIAKPEFMKKERSQLVKKICGNVDGKAANRIVETVIRLSRKNGN